jgi:hypothetical protein
METYKKVFIRSESDLPELKGSYTACNKSNKYTRPCIFDPNDPDYVSLWLRTIDWYLQPITSANRLSDEEIHDEIASRWINPTPENDYEDNQKWNNFFEGAKWMRDNISPLPDVTDHVKDEKKEEICTCEDGGDYLDGAFDTHCYRCKKHLS